LNIHSSKHVKHFTCWLRKPLQREVGFLPFISLIKCNDFVFAYLLPVYGSDSLKGPNSCDDALAKTVKALLDAGEMRALVVHDRAG
jgi:hypothetical protein